MLALRNRALELVVAEVDATVTSIDALALSNQSGTAPLNALQHGYSQSVQQTTGSAISATVLMFYLRKVGSPTGTATAKLYASTGTHGADALPTGAALASATLNVATLTTSFVEMDLLLSAAVSIVSGTTYCVALEYTGGDASNYVQLGTDPSSPTHAGNSAGMSPGGVWTDQAGIDTIFALTSESVLSATANGYARLSGSFVTDGYMVGMEVQPTGFTQTDPGVISAVSASALTILGGRTVQAAATGRTLDVGVPALRAWENVALRPTSGQHYIEESYVPGTSKLWTFRAQGGQCEETGLYVLRWYGLSGHGPDGLRACVDALKALFAPGTSFTITGGIIRVRTDIGPWAGEIRRLDGGWAVVTLTIPWLARSTNVIAA